VVGWGCRITGIALINREALHPSYRLGTGLTRANYDVDLDDQRLLMVKDEGESGRLNVVLNWLEELKRLAPPAGR
jgi:hypothetical protein